MGTILKIPFLRNILMASSVIALVLPLIVILLVYPAFRELLVKNTEAQAVMVGKHFANMFSGSSTAADVSHHKSDLPELIIEGYHDFGLMKVKVYSAKGEVLFSTVAAEIGSQNTMPYFKEIISQGNVYTNVVRKNAPSLEGQMITADVVETYVPMMKKGIFLGAFEIYYDITAKKARLDRLLHNSAWMLILLSLSLEGGIIAVLWKAGKTVLKRQEVEKRLREEKEISEAVLNSIADPISIIDPTNFRLIGANKAFLKEVKYTRETIKGTNCFQLTHKGESPCVDATHPCPMKRTVETGGVSVAEHIHYRPDGELYYVDVTTYPIKDETGRVTKVVHVAREVSERKKAEAEKKELEEKLARSQKMEAVGLLAGGVAHDLNNVLSGIVSYPDLLLMELAPDSPLLEPIRTIRDSGKKAAAIVEDMLTMARRGVTSTVVLKLNTIVAEYLESPEFEKLMSHHQNVRVDTDLADDLFNIRGSAVHLKKTVMNLVANAAEAAVNGGRVAITTTNWHGDLSGAVQGDISAGDYVVLRVEDNGIGIEADDLKRIFEPFYTKKVMGRSGTGLGMAVVWGTVQDLNGHIDVKSEPGQGTVFKLFFPAVSEKIKDEDEAVPIAQYTGAGESVLVVDDLEAQQEIACAMLTKLGYAVSAVASGEAALNHLDNERVDLVILDMIMEDGMDGLDTHIAIIDRFPHQKTIIASGFSESQRVKKAQAMGAGLYLKKPYSLEKLGAAVKQALAEKKQQD